LVKTVLFFQCRTRSFQSLFGCVLAPVFGNIVNKVFRHLSSKSPLCNVEFELKFVAGTWKNNRPKNQQFQGDKNFFIMHLSHLQLIQHLVKFVTKTGGISRTSPDTNDCTQVLQQ